MWLDHPIVTGGLININLSPLLPPRTSGATHRSLPDIPTVDDIEAVRGNSGNERGISVDNGPGGNGQGGDTNSDLYATVGDKVVVQQRAMPGREYLKVNNVIYK